MTKLKIQYSELVELHSLINEFIENINNKEYDKRFNHALYRTFEYLQPEITAIKNTQKNSDKFSEFQQKIYMIGKECADKDENGNPKLTTINGDEIFVINERKAECHNKILVLNEEYKDVIEEQKKQIEQFNELMKDFVEVDICQVSFKYFPNEYNPKKHKILKFLIKETDEEIENNLL